MSRCDFYTARRKSNDRPNALESRHTVNLGRGSLLVCHAKFSCDGTVAQSGGRSAEETRSPMVFARFANTCPEHFLLSEHFLELLLAFLAIASIADEISNASACNWLLQVVGAELIVGPGCFVHSCASSFKRRCYGPWDTRVWSTHHAGILGGGGIS